MFQQLKQMLPINSSKFKILGELSKLLQKCLANAVRNSNNPKSVRATELEIFHLEFYRPC